MAHVDSWKPYGGGASCSSLRLSLSFSLSHRESRISHTKFHTFLTVVLLVICTCTYLKMQFPAILEQKKKSVDPEEEDAEEKDYENSDEEDGNHGIERYGSSSASVFDFSASHSARDSGLPSANDVFSQVHLLMMLIAYQQKKFLQPVPFLSSCLGYFILTVFSWKQNLSLSGSMRESETILMHNLLKRMVESEYLLQPIQMQKKLQIS
ncbi:hypothetical protein HID58_054240 [Brassica napus]|uniref:Uncharacterized protein n=1 Tax=Brassica napus TaxID=3708 RepID=A0ABQ8AH34_BRANA|nr:hypothetical protein HID58_054240 [Brassica napus]